jgi:hypothetical protein
MSAVKLWNDSKPTNTAFCVPIKNTKEYYEVLAIMESDMAVKKNTTATNAIKAVVKRNIDVKAQKDATSVLKGAILRKVVIDKNKIGDQDEGNQEIKAKKRDYLTHSTINLNQDALLIGTYRKFLVRLIDIITPKNKFEEKYLKIAVLKRIEGIYRKSEKDKASINFKIDFKRILNITYDTFFELFKIKPLQYIPEVEGATQSPVLNFFDYYK